MIGKIKGILDKVSISEVIIDCNGVGYEIIIPLSTYDKLPREGEKLVLFSHLHVREGEMTLFGFATQEEKDLFRLLNTITGIGPRLAVKILSSISVTSFCEAISSADIKTLSKINGVGPKSAQRLIIELKDKISIISPESAYSTTAASAPPKHTEEAILALVSLGFKYDMAKKTVLKIVSEIPSAEQSSENIIRIALQNLNS
ncbi:MAG TPA: Holliday junction branch migration protein RuvA [Lentisphaeria bacterium]|nr:MAG: Holliday junction DNA helicase RuvA [Lentisphaerae bacterium GWF2_38_69]HBM16578.1 Holliday junction branch migration protein RuvA [Lentisphaeria bacterium]